MEVTHFVNPAIMGGLGYALGVVTKTDPKWTALTWALAELAIQLFKQIDNFKNRNFEYPTRLLVGAAACIYLSEQHSLSKLNYVLASLLTFCIIPDIISRYVWQSMGTD